MSRAAIYSGCRLVLVFLMLFFIGIKAQAAPYFGERFSYTQPDGTRFEIRLYGDEFHAVEETLEGYVVVRDPASRFFCYAVLSSDGSAFVPAWDGESRVGVVDPVELGCEKGIRITPAARIALVKDAQEEAGVDGQGRVSARTRKLAGMPKVAPSTQTLGDRIGLVLLIRFPDRPEEVVHTREAVDALCNQPNYSDQRNDGSVYDYFYTQSQGRLRYTSVVTAYYTAEHPKSYYDDPNKSESMQSRLLAEEALIHLRDGVGFDFSRCDGNGDGQIDGINVFYAGRAESPYGYGLWPHKSVLSFAPGDGMNSGTQHYQITDMKDVLDRITYCHENGHLICDFPDLYDTDKSSYGAGNYCLMSFNTSPNPAPVSAYLKYAAGWAEVINVDSASHLRAAATVDGSLFYRYANPANPKEYFIVENRQKMGSQANNHVYDEGLMIWHIDEAASNNHEQGTPTEHYEAAVEQADGLFDLENSLPSREGDLFHAGYKDLFNDLTMPNAHWWSGGASALEIHSIGLRGETMTFVVGGGAPTGSPTIETGLSGINAVCDYGNDAAPRSFTLWNSGSGSFSYSVSDNADWIDCSPTNGTCGSNADVVYLSFDTAALPSGTTNAVITISSSEANNSPRTIALSLTVLQPPVMALSQSNVVKTVVSGTVFRETIELENTGEGTLAYTVIADQPWLHVAPGQGTLLTEVDILTIDMDAVGLENGTYTGTVTVAGNGAANSPQTILVSMTVSGWTGAEMDVYGNGTEVQCGQTTPLLLNLTDFGYAETAGGTVEHGFSVSSAGVSNLLLNGSTIVEISGSHASDFSVSLAPASTSLAPAGSTPFRLLFNPSASGLRTALVSIANNSNTEAPYTFAVQGQGHDTHFFHVSPNGGHLPPYDSWATAATNIQAAVDATLDGDIVLVSNGTYAVGSTLVPSNATPCRVAIANAVIVKSLNGPEVTRIVGSGPLGSSAVRCAYVGDGAILDGFTLTNGFTQTTSVNGSNRDLAGGGAWCEEGGTVRNCTIASNRSLVYGGGTIYGTIQNCIITGNSSAYGGGSYYGTAQNCAIMGNFATRNGGGSYRSGLDNCTLIGNTADEEGGGVYDGRGVYNSIIYHNTAPLGPNWFYGDHTFSFNFTTPLPQGAGNSALDPLVAGLDNPHLLSGSPCIDAGFNPRAPNLPDIDGEDRFTGAAVDVGCDERPAGSTSGPLAAGIEVNASSFILGSTVEFIARIDGQVDGFGWNLGDGTVATNLVAISRIYPALGSYNVVLNAWNATQSVSVTNTIEIVPGTNYVSLAGSHTYPFASWATAATNIQAAVDAAAAGSSVLVSNGVYNTGGAVVDGALTNRVAITKAITLTSVNGSESTFIVGQGPIGDSAVRCVYLDSGAVLSGFTLTNGFTRSYCDDNAQQDGGGIYCEDDGVILTNCVITGCEAYTYGGGSRYGTLQNCRILGSKAGFGGGGTYKGALNNCAVIGNYSGRWGGGTYYSTLYNCTVTENSAWSSGGGTRSYSFGIIRNCIIYNNNAPDDPNWREGDISHSFTLPLPPGTGNSTNDPAFVCVGNPHLMPHSPCIDAGTNAYVQSTTDIDGEARIQGGTVDAGCDERTSGPAAGPLSVAMSFSPEYTIPGAQVDFTARIEGAADAFAWTFDDGGQAVTNSAEVSHIFTAGGAYNVVLTAWNGETTAATTGTVFVLPSVTYVSHGGSHSYPYADWATAATNIQTAIDVAAAESTIVVSNGVYDTGSVFHEGNNRIAINKAITVTSLSGADATHIVGAGPKDTPSSIRCAYISDGAVLEGFTLRDGTTDRSGTWDQQRGGGALCSPGATLRNCIVTQCDASYTGGGVNGGTVVNCVLSNNNGNHGGGAYSATLESSLISSNDARYGGGLNGCTARGCTIVANNAYMVGGVRYGTLQDCIVVDNQPNNHASATLTYSCTTPLPAGDGNTNANPAFVDAPNGDYQLRFGSPCIDSGTNSFAAGALDLSGFDRVVNSLVDMGAYERQLSDPGDPITVSFSVSPTLCLAGGSVELSAWIDGPVDDFAWDFGDGGVLSNAVITTHTYASEGSYAVVLRAWNATHSVSATNRVTVAVATNYVSLSGSHISPFATWTSAATNIQAAIDVAASGATVLVSNGVYNTGSVSLTGLNRIAITNAVTVKSMAGADATHIVGSGSGGAIRCAYIGNGSVLDGFTLRDGYTTVDGLLYETSGGGAFCEEGARLRNSIVRDCWCSRLGGAVYEGTVERCLIYDNVSAYHGGGTSHADVWDSLIRNNHVVSHYGSGIYAGTAYGCTIVSNTSVSTSTSACGAYTATLVNCILVGNTPRNYYGSSIAYSCTTPLPSGPGNTEAAPLFVDAASGNYWLQPGSPCVNRGLNYYASGETDLEGNPRILGGTVDLGAYEQVSTLFDSDGDLFSDYGEYVADTDMLDSNDWFRVSGISSNTVFFGSSSNRLYSLLWSTNLVEGLWTSAAQPRMGIGGADSMTSTNNLPVEFYKLEVQLP